MLSFYHSRVRKYANTLLHEGIHCSRDSEVFLQPVQLLSCPGDDIVLQSFPEAQTSPSKVQQFLEWWYFKVVSGGIQSEAGVF